MWLFFNFSPSLPLLSCLWADDLPTPDSLLSSPCWLLLTLPETGCPLTHGAASRGHDFIHREESLGKGLHRGAMLSIFKHCLSHSSGVQRVQAFSESVLTTARAFRIVIVLVIEAVWSSVSSIYIQSMGAIHLSCGVIWETARCKQQDQGWMNHQWLVFSVDQSVFVKDDSWE